MDWAKCEISTFAVLFSELFENIDAETETGESPSKDSEPKTNETEPQTEPSRKRSSSIVILDDEEIEEFQRNQVAKNTAKGTESAVRRLQAWYNDRYGKSLELASINKTNASGLLKHFFLEIRDTRKDRLGEEYEPSTLSTYRNGLKRFLFEEKDEDEDELKAERKGNCPNRADQLDESQIEKLWTSGAVGLKTPRQLLHLMWWNNTRLLG